MIYPDFLKQGSCIGVPAPSSGAYNNLYNNRYNNAKKKLEEKGYKVVLSKKYLIHIKCVVHLQKKGQKS